MKITVDTEHLTFFATLEKHSQGSLLKALKWAEKNPLKSSEIIRQVEGYPPAWRKLFGKLLGKNPPDLALEKTKKLRRLMRDTVRGGYLFSTRNGLQCVLKRLDKTQYYRPIFAGILSCLSGNPREASRRVAKDLCQRYFVFLFERGEATFGLVYGISVLRTEADVATRLGFLAEKLTAKKSIISLFCRLIKRTLKF